MIADMELIPIKINYRNNSLRIALAKSLVNIHPLLPTISKKMIDKKEESNSAGKGSIERESLHSVLSADPLRFDPSLHAKISKVSAEDDQLENHISCKPEIFHSSQRMLRDVPQRAAAKTSWQIFKEKIVNDYAMILHASTTVADSNFNNSHSDEIEDNSLSQIGVFQDRYDQRLASLETKAGTNKSISSSVKKIEVIFCILNILIDIGQNYMKYCIIFTSFW